VGIVVKQYKNLVAAAENSFITARIAYFQVALTLANSPYNPVALASQLVLEDVLLQAWIKVALLNATLNNVKDVLNGWQLQYAQEASDVSEKLARIAKGLWSTVADIKAAWRNETATIRSTFADYLEDFDNCTVISDDYSDVNSSSPSLAISWELDTDLSVNPSDKINKVKITIINILAAEGTFNKSSITVTVTQSAKRSSQLSAGATVASTSPSTSSSNNSNGAASDTTYYIIGGVIGGIVFLAIIIIVVLILVKKRADERV